MIVAVIIILVLVIAWSIHKDFKKHKTTPATIPVNQDAVLRAEKRHKRLMVRGARLNRHRRIWSVLYLTNSFYEIEERMKKGQPTKRMFQHLESAKNYVLEYKPTTDEIKTAIRFCQIEHVRGKCPHALTASDIETIMNIYSVAQQPSTIPQN